jgi:hypothetical protein
LISFDNYIDINAQGKDQRITGLTLKSHADADKAAAKGYSMAKPT